MVRYQGSRNLILIDLAFPKPISEVWSSTWRTVQTAKSPPQARQICPESLYRSPDVPHRTIQQSLEWGTVMKNRRWNVIIQITLFNVLTFSDESSTHKITSTALGNGVSWTLATRHIYQRWRVVRHSVICEEAVRWYQYWRTRRVRHTINIRLREFAVMHHRKNRNPKH